MSEVSHTHDTRIDWMVALKIPTETFSSDSDCLRGFQDEARILSSLNHPSVLAIYDVGEKDGAR